MPQYKLTLSARTSSAKPLSSAHEDMSRHGHDLATPRRFSVIEQGFEPCINLLLETGKSLDLP